jgi:Peptidase family M28
VVSTDVSERFFASAPARWAGTARALMLLLLLVAPAFLAIYQQLPPAPVAADAPREDFSSARALSHLQAIAQEPHPIGSEENAAVRDYIYGELRAQGLDPQVQAALAVGADRANQHRAGMVRNVVARLKGTGGGKAVLLTAHYDSVPTGPGANDDGVGVATLLETARALRAASPLRNDVIFLFTDGEEAGLLGARAFADEHPWAKEVGVALNFEARGNGGPAVMFETSDGNDWMIKEFAAAAPAPVANSLSYEIYKRMPNDTDLSVFKKGGVPGMNFAYIDGLTHYHTGADDLQSVSESSLQHQGSYSLSLARRFGGLSLNGGNSANAIYFNLPGPLFVHYGGALVLPLAGSAALLYALFVFLGFRRGMLTAKGFALGVVALPTSCVAASLAVTTAWSLTRPLLKVFESMPWGEPRGVGFYVIALVLITVAVFAALYNLFLRRARVADLTAGALLWWALLTLAAGVMMPGASYLLVWPLLCALAGMVILFARGEQESPVHWGALALVAVPAVALFGPLIDQVFTALTLNAGGKVAVLLVLLCGLLIPHFRMLAGTKEWTLPA